MFLLALGEYGLIVFQSPFSFLDKQGALFCGTRKHCFSKTGPVSRLKANHALHARTVKILYRKLCRERYLINIGEHNLYTLNIVCAKHHMKLYL